MQHGNGQNGYPANDQLSKNSRRWRAYSSWMFSYAEKLVGTNDADDVANAALFDAYWSDKPQPAFENESEVKKYLATLIWFRARAFWKKDRKYRQQVLYLADLENTEEQFVVGKPWELILDLIMLERTLEKLPPEDRDLILKYLGEGFTGDELAAEYDSNESTVRSRINRARKALNEQSKKGQKKRNKAFAVFIPIDQIQMGLAKLKQSIISWLSVPSFTKVLVAVSICAASAIPLAQSSAFEARINTEVDSKTAGPIRDSMSPAPRHSAVETKWITAHAEDVPHVKPTNQPVSVPPPHPNPKAPKPELEATNVSTPPARVEPPRMATTPRSCNNALSLAFVKADNRDAQGCLDILAENAAGPTKCSDDELQTARKLCQPSPPR
ncbi:MAG TPA: RNA polymerase sigma factor [Polyangium sp.]|nr:RNA polymerase sigma factor [Polyangium sp.]